MAEKTPTTPEAKEPTLKEILGDKEQSVGFNIWLESQDKGELVARIHEGKLEEADLGALAEQRTEFLKRQKESAEMQASLDNPEVLAKFIKDSDDLRKVAELVGEDGIREVVKTVIEDYSLNRDEETGDPAHPIAKGNKERHELLYEAFSGWKKSEVRVQEKEKALQELLAQFQLTPEEAERVSQNYDENERRKLVAKIMHEKGQKPEAEVRDWFFWKKPAWSEKQKQLFRQAAAELSTELDLKGNLTTWAEIRDDLAAARVAFDFALPDIVENLKSVVTHDGRKEISRILTSEKKPKETMLSFGELKKEIEKIKKPEYLEDDFFAYAESEFTDFIDGSGMPLGTDDEKDAAVDSFFQQYARHLSGTADSKSGIWKAMYETFVAPVIGPLLDECLAELKGKDKMKIDVAKKTLFRKNVKKK